ncbi:MAG: hypothetical protein WCZ27_09005 [Tissierellaceae bacterium]
MYSIITYLKNSSILFTTTAFLTFSLLTFLTIYFYFFGYLVSSRKLNVVFVRSFELTIALSFASITFSALAWSTIKLTGSMEQIFYLLFPFLQVLVGNLMFSLIIKLYERNNLLKLHNDCDIYCVSPDELKRNINFLFFLGPIMTIMLYIYLKDTNKFEVDSFVVTILSTLIGRFFWYDTNYHSFLNTIREFTPEKSYLKQLILPLLFIVIIAIIDNTMPNDFFSGFNLGYNFYFFILFVIYLILRIKDILFGKIK